MRVRLAVKPSQKPIMGTSTGLASPGVVHKRENLALAGPTHLGHGGQQALDVGGVDLADGSRET